MWKNTLSCIYWCQNIGREYFFPGKSSFVDFTIKYNLKYVLLYNITLFENFSDIRYD